MGKINWNMIDSLQVQKDNKLNELNKVCNQSISKGFYSSVLGEEHFYRFNLEEDQINFNQQATMLLLNASVTSVYWKTEDAGILLHSREQFLQLLDDASNHKQNNIDYYWQLKNQVLNATTIEEVNSIVWSR
jgi:hypothetical protein